MRFAVPGFVIISLLLSSAAFAAPPSIVVGSYSGAPGVDVDLSVSFTAGDTDVSAAQFDLAYDPLISFVSVTAGDAATAAVKQVADNQIGSIHRFIIFGFNQNAIPSGGLVTIRLHLDPALPPAAYALAISNVVSSDPSANAVATNASDGNLNVRVVIPVHFHDLNGDGNSELVLARSASVRIFLADSVSLADWVSPGGAAVLSPKLTANSRPGLGASTGSSSGLITARKERSRLRWEQVNVSSGRRANLALFGSSSSTPIFGCATANKFLAATFSSGNLPAVQFPSGKLTRKLSLPAGSTAVRCSDESGSASLFYFLLQTKKSTSVQAYSQSRRRVLASAALPSGLRAPKLLLLPKAGANKVTPAVLDGNGHTVELLVYDTAARRWSRQNLAIATRGVRSVTAGNESGEFRWIVVQTQEGKFFLVKLLDSNLVSSVTALSGVPSTTHDLLL